MDSIATIDQDAEHKYQKYNHELHQMNDQSHEQLLSNPMLCGR
jgi:uncharacterized protein YaaN involved in tellurite resistance